MRNIHSFFPQGILFTRLKTTQNPKSRSFLLRTASMLECTLFILCCSCPGPSMACSEAETAHWVLCWTPALVPAGSTAWKKAAGRSIKWKMWPRWGLKKCKYLHPHSISVDEGRWECENIYSSKVIWLGTVSWEFQGKKGETTKKYSHRPDKTTMETLTRNKPCQSCWWTGCSETTGTTHSKISMRQEWFVSLKAATGGH